MKFILQVILLHISVTIFAQNTKGVEIVYGHKDGLALTMIMLKPTAHDNGKAIINIISGNWYSSYAQALRIETQMGSFLDAGYTIFNVMHGSQPRYNITEAVSDIKRSVRYIRFNAASLKIDPAHIGITGRSSGGHLALMVATTGTGGDSSAADPVNKVSDRIQAVAVFYPPADLLNFGGPGFAPVNVEALLKQFGIAGAFDFKKWDVKKQAYEYPSPEERMKIAREMSPVYNATPDDAPALLIHGDSDKVVPLQQSQVMLTAYQNAKVPASLVVKKGGGHGWRDVEAEEKQFIQWFDLYLK
jgi:acetyl esterase/lipase